MSTNAAAPGTSASRILDHAIDVLRTTDVAHGHLIDIPCGTGYLSERATREGWDVSAADLLPELWQGNPATKIQKADLDATLPFPDTSADAVVCCEGLEHIENPWNALREFRRILKPGGNLITSIPNTVDLRQRFRMLRRGHWGHYFPSVADHQNHMGTFVLCHALMRNGFTIRSISSPKQYGGFFRLLVPLFRFSPTCGLPEDVCAMLSRPAVLCARTVVILATADKRAEE